MSEHYKSLSAVYPIILKEEKGHQYVLLHQRMHTGYMDGYWDFAGSGHVDENESAIEAVVRECWEEIDIEVERKDVAFVHLCHRIGKNGARTYYDLYFVVSSFAGLPRIAEPDKCSDLQWFDITRLPDTMIIHRRDAFDHYLHHEVYSEITYTY